MNSYYNKEKMSNGIYRITSTLPKISLKEDFTANLLDDKHVNQMNFNEREYVTIYDRNVSGILRVLSKFQSQIYDLKRAYGHMEDNLAGLSEVFDADEELSMISDTFG